MTYFSSRSALSRKRLAVLCVAIAAGTASTYGLAQTGQVADAEARYRQDVEYCRSGQTTQDVETCLREAGAALQAARRQALTAGTPAYETNQTARCDHLTGSQREDCLRLMADPGAQVRGSVDGGGILREMTITIPASEAPGTGIRQ